MEPEVNNTLRRFNFDFNLKEEQVTVIQHVMSSLPTGFWKSMCYVIPPLISKRTALVISPLKSIINEQRTFLKSKGIKVAILVTTRYVIITYWFWEKYVLRDTTANFQTNGTRDITSKKHNQ